MNTYQRRLARLCDKAIHERDQDKLKELLDEILRLLAANQNDSTRRGPELVPNQAEEGTLERGVCKIGD
jgi:hypothetical protein